MKRIRYDAQQFKKCLADKHGLPDGLPDGALLVKGFAPTIEKDIDGPGSRIVQFVISTGAVDRDGDTINPNGWDLASFQKAGSILWGHDSYEPPIAESLSVWVENNALKAKCRFPEADVYAFSDTIYRLIQANVIRSTSVGFKPKSWTETNERPGNWGPALDFQTQELLEYSVVSVPANPEALVEAKSLGINMGPYISWAEKTLDTMAKSGLLVPRNDLERAYFAAKGTTSVPVKTKAGKVLSAANKEKLTKAMGHIQDVIDSAQDPDDDGDNDQDPAQDDPAEDPKKPPKSAGAPGTKTAPEPIEEDADLIDVDDEIIAVFGPLVKQSSDEPRMTMGTIEELLRDMVHDALERARGR